MIRVLAHVLACIPLIPEFCLTVAVFALIAWGSIIAAALVAPAL